MDTTVFILILIINALLVICYILWGFLFRRKKEGMAQYFMNGTVMLICPVMGASFLFFGTCFRKIFMHREVDLADVIFSKDRVKTNVRADEEREKNIVPMEEALAVSDVTSLRQYMLNVLTRDISGSLYAISEAVNSDDPETAHYAASALSDQLSKFRSDVHKMYSYIKQLDSQEVQDEELMNEKCQSIYTLVVYIERFISQGVISSLEMESYTRIMNEICDILYEERPEMLTVDFYENAVYRLMKVGEHEKAEELALRAFDYYPDELSAYTSALKLYFTLKNKEKFGEIVKRLKESELVLDETTRELINAFEPETDNAGVEN